MKRDTKVMLAGFDADRDARRGVGSPVRVVRRPVPADQLRPMGIRAALEWAFGAECAQIDFDDVPVYQVGIDTIWRMMRNNELGCRVDGGGHSASHADAEIIASFVAALPIEYGGKRMALQIAELSRAGLCPDAMIDAGLRCVPLHLAGPNQHGPRAKTEDVPADEPGRFEPARGVGRPSGPLRWCRVTYTPTAAQIASARRNWLGWWGALMHLGYQLQTCGRLEMVRITPDMSPLDPWNKRS